jgi:Helix-turn-helix domain
LQPDAPFALRLDPAGLAPLIRSIVSEVLAQIEADRQMLPENGKLCFSEAEAAAMLGVEPHVLRDERRRGRIGASQIMGRRIKYTRADLLSYLAQRHIEPAK